MVWEQIEVLKGRGSRAVCSVDDFHIETIVIINKCMDGD